MTTTRTRQRTAAITLAATLALSVAACGSSSDTDPLSGGGRDSDTLVVGSQDYYSSEILAELYAQALEDGGFEVERDLRIGQREVYVPEIEDGEIDVFPEYTGPLLQYWEPDTAARSTDDVYAALTDAAPAALRVLDQAEATDQDAYVVSRAFADRYDVDSVDDLAALDIPLTIGGNSEGEHRPNGPDGLRAAYGLEVAFTPIEDGGGPLTVAAIKDDDVQLAIIYTGSPLLLDDDLVVLEDPAELLLASHVVPVASDRVDDEAAAIIDAVTAALGASDLLELNARSVEDQSPAAAIAGDWLREKGLVG